MSNLKPAPLAFTPTLVAKLVGECPAYGKGVARIPFEGIVNGADEPELPLADCGPLTVVRGADA